MVLLLSYPRSGNHLVRYIIEFLTGQATLGCFSNRVQDSPIFKRYSVRLLGHVKEDAPVAKKSHFAYELKDHKCDKLIFILRDPVEAILSHRETRNRDAEYLAIVNEWFLGNFKYYEDFEGPKAIVSYEDLAFNKQEKAIRVLASFFNVADDTVNNFVDNYGIYKEDSYSSLSRGAISNDPKFYAKKATLEDLVYIQEDFKMIFDHPIYKECYGQSN